MYSFSLRIRSEKPIVLLEFDDAMPRSDGLIIPDYRYAGNQYELSALSQRLLDLLISLVLTERIHSPDSRWNPA